MSEVAGPSKVRLNDLSPRLTRFLPQLSQANLAVLIALAGALSWSNFYGSLLPVVELMIGTGYALLVVSLTGLLVGSNFVTVRKIQYFLSRSYLLAGASLPVLVIVDLLLRFPGPTPRLFGFPVWPPFALLIGIAFFVVGISLPWLWVFEPDAEGRLCLLQFLNKGRDSDSGSSWLRDGLGFVQRKMSRTGLSIPENSLFLGARYGFANGSLSGPEILELSQWLDENHVTTLPSAALSLLSLSKEAVEKGFERRRSWMEHLFGTRNLAQKAIAIFSGLLAILVYAHTLGFF